MEPAQPPTQPFTIRPFEEADTKAVVELWRVSGLTTPWNDPYQDIARKLTVQRELFVTLARTPKIYLRTKACAQKSS